MNTFRVELMGKLMRTYREADDPAAADKARAYAATLGEDAEVLDQSDGAA